MGIKDIYAYNDVTLLVKEYGHDQVSNYLEDQSNNLIFKIKYLRGKLSDIKMLMSIELNSDELRHLKYSHEEVQDSIDDNINKLNHTHTLIASSTYTKLKS